MQLHVLFISFSHLVDDKTSNEYAPDEFSSKNEDLKLNFGRLEPEVFIELKYED